MASLIPISGGDSESGKPAEPTHSFVSDVQSTASPTSSYISDSQSYKSAEANPEIEEDLVDIADITGPPGDSALGVEPQQEALAGWVDSDNPFGNKIRKKVEDLESKIPELSVPPDFSLNPRKFYSTSHVLY